MTELENAVAQFLKYAKLVQECAEMGNLEHLWTEAHEAKYAASTIMLELDAIERRRVW